MSGSIPDFASDFARDDVGELQGKALGVGGESLCTMPDLLAYTIAQAAEAAATGKTALYEALGSGELPARKRAANADPCG
jgi:hypothetical protein